MRILTLSRHAALLLILAPAPALHAGETALQLPVPLAHSALITLSGTVAADGLTLQVHGNPPAAPFDLAVSDLKVALDGQELPVTPQSGGVWHVSLPQAETARHPLEVTVTHDGVRELLSAQLPAAPGAAPAPAKAAAGGAGLHNQLVWWIFNIAIVLIAAVVISRRMS